VFAIGDGGFARRYGDWWWIERGVVLEMTL